ncbi:hypothetical protein HYPSUDRAFT_207911 [Hypholoma sublateritium FD-334 SS-4]|uniref:Uncharacterized protein n=1 Tax=Hypholoma sublateritium (strain FD-334 SS-4) TaxID=945553 RepID=A0A0D2P4L8_HYPSF|nr:hypothetical protein HYPSUDRAFT_207911 [Hypholoma sublateritium FD-334 SS-4]
MARIARDQVVQPVLGGVNGDAINGTQDEEQHSQAQVDPGAEIARLKRRLAASQDEVKELTQGKVKKPPTTVTMGRAIRRLLQKGANDARSDDVRRIKEEIALWLNLAHAPNPPLNTKSRSDRGLHNDITGRLLCPIEYDWDDEL